MNTIFQIPPNFLIALLVAGLCGQPLPAEDVCIPDQNLEAAVRAELGKPDGTLTTNDLASLRRLVAPNAGIATYSGMEAATNLEVLDLSGNHLLTSLVLPDEMPRLAELDLASSQVSHLSLPQSAPALVDLNLNGNPLNHLILPGDLSLLETLELQFTNIGSLHLPVLPSLRTLDLYYAGLSTVELPLGLRALETLNVGGNPIKTLSFPPGLENLKTLDISETLLPDYGFLEQLPALKELTTNNDAHLLDQLVTPPELTSLTLYGADRFSPSLLRRFPKLKTLRAAFYLRTLPPELASLEELDLSGSGITSLTIPPELVNLRRLNLGSCINLGALELPPQLPDLEHFRLSETRLQRLVLPAGLAKLEVLDLAGLGLTELQLSEGMTSLRELHLQENRLSRLELPKGLENLKHLDVSDNLLDSCDVPIAVETLAIQNLGWKDLSPLQLQGTAVKHLSIGGPGFGSRSVQFPPGLETLTDLEVHLTSEFAAQLEIVANLPALHRLRLESAESLSGALPAGLGSVEELEVSGGGFESLSFSAPVPGIRSLSVTSTTVLDFDFIADFPNVTSLTLQNNGTWRETRNLTIPASLNKLATLDLRSQSISSLTLPHGFSNLKSLRLSRNYPLPSLTLPPGLSGLEELSFGFLNRNISQVSLSEGMSSLTSLSISGNNSWATSLTIPAGMTSLTTLHLDSRSRRAAEDDDEKEKPQFEKISFAGPLPALRHLTVLSYGLSEFSLPEGSSELKSLTLHGTGVSNLELPNNLSHLEHLDLRENAFTSLDLPAELPKLRSLRLNGNLLNELSLPDGMSKLWNLDLSNNGLIKLQLPNNLDSLASLNLAENFLTAVPSGGPFPLLQDLDLDGNRIQDIALLADHRNLTSLSLRGNQMTGSLVIPPGLDNLASLDLGQNRLEHLSFTAQHQHLHSLRADSNQLGNGADFLEETPNLAFLDLSANGLVTMELPPPQLLPPLSRLHLSANQLSDASFLADFPFLTSLLIRENQVNSLLLPDLPDLRELGISFQVGPPSVTLSGELAACWLKSQMGPSPVSFDLNTNDVRVIDLPPREPSRPVLHRLEKLPYDEAALLVSGAANDCVVEMASDGEWTTVLEFMGRPGGQRLIVEAKGPRAIYRIRSIP